MCMPKYRVIPFRSLPKTVEGGLEDPLDRAIFAHNSASTDLLEYHQGVYKNVFITFKR